MTYSVSQLLQPTSPERLYTSNYESMANVVDPLARGESDRLSAYQLYENGRYSEAVDSFKTIDPSQNKFFYEGLCYLQLEDVNQSILKFENGLKLPPEGLKENLEWYLLLAYIKKGEVQKAIEYVRELKENPTHQFLQKIEQMEQELLEM
jgi:tetratricopeptide (TPR) repeat protein